MQGGFELTSSYLVIVYQDTIGKTHNLQGYKWSIFDIYLIRLTSNNIHMINLGNYGVFRLSYNLALSLYQDRVGMDIFLCDKDIY